MRIGLYVALMIVVMVWLWGAVSHEASLAWVWGAAYSAYVMDQMDQIRESAGRG